MQALTLSSKFVEDRLHQARVNRVRDRQQRTAQSFRSCALQHRADGLFVTGQHHVAWSVVGTQLDAITGNTLLKWSL